MKVAVAQINSRVGDIEGNCEKIAATGRKAHQLGTDLIIFPEMCIPGFPGRDLLRHPALVDANIAAVSKLAAQIPEIGCVVGFADRNPLTEGRPLYSAAALIEGGEIQYVCYKANIPAYEDLDQTRLFEPAVGASMTKYKDKRLAITLGEDLWTDEALGRRAGFAKSVLEDVAKRKIELVINLAANPYTLGMDRRRLELLKVEAVKHKVPIVMCNLVGGNDEFVFDGTSGAVSATGEIIARAKSFEEDIVFIDLVYGAGDIHGEGREDADLVMQGLVVGVRDFVRKSGSERAVVGLAGDLDSAVTAAVAAEALGKENVRALLMPGADSKPDRIAAAQELARGLGIRFDVVELRRLTDAHLGDVERFFSGKARPATLASLQTRIRTALVSSLAGETGAVALACGNKSQQAAGLGARAGELPDGLFPLGDVPRTMVRKIAHEVINRDATVIPA
ncbi:MAG TPA: NAD(+) synthase, partial [Planctomycetota bacterium]|nr:NAD(+) synthase [Planctomycetota bacterium]